jgi:sRNA-binding protein
MTGRRNIMPALELLATRWPNTFNLYQYRRWPLKIGIDLEIVAALDGAIPTADLKLALRIYTSNKIYRRRLVAGAVRIDLSGEPTGVVTPEQVPPPPKPRLSPSKVVTPPKPTRLGFAGLKAAAEARRRKAAAS